MIRLQGLVIDFLPLFYKSTIYVPHEKKSGQVVSRKKWSGDMHTNGLPECLCESWVGA